MKSHQILKGQIRMKQNAYIQYYFPSGKLMNHIVGIGITSLSP